MYLFLNQGIDGPFPWRCAATSNNDNQGAQNQQRQGRSSSSTSDPKWARSLNQDVLSLARTRDVFNKVDADACLSYRLPPLNATAGRVIHHACEVFEGLMIQHKPMSFKFGFTHCASARWHNRKFGYRYDKLRFQQMIILYAAASPDGPAFLEATLIKQYQSFLSQNMFGHDGCMLYERNVSVQRKPRLGRMPEPASWWGYSTAGYLSRRPIPHVYCFPIFQDPTEGSLMFGVHLNYVYQFVIHVLAKRASFSGKCEPQKKRSPFCAVSS